MALDRLRAFKISRLGSFSGDLSDSRSRNDNNLVSTWEEIERDERNANALHNVRSPDGDYIHSSNFPFRGRRKRRHRNRDDAEKTAELAPSRDSNAGLEPEEIVPSALEDILAQGPDRERQQPQQPPPMQKKHSRHIADSLQANNESDDMLGEIDYATALRDVQRHSKSSNHDSSS